MMLHNIVMKDGSRHFGDIPQMVGYSELRDHVAKLTGAVETDFLTDGLAEMWMDFSYMNYRFSVNYQLSEYWFFVDDPKCPDAILENVLSHFRELLIP